MKNKNKEIEKLEKEIERLKLIVKERFNENKVTQTISEFNERQNYRIELAEKEAKLSGLKQGIELTEKKYSNQKKEIIEKIENKIIILESYAEEKNREDVWIGIRKSIGVLKELIKQIEDAEKGRSKE